MQCFLNSIWISQTSEHFFFNRIVLLDFDATMKVKRNNQLIFIINSQVLNSLLNIDVLIIQLSTIHKIISNISLFITHKKSFVIDVKLKERNVRS